MAKTAMIRARIEPELKRQAEETFSELGLSATEAITLFYKQVTVHGGLPFDVRIPNAETIEALEQSRGGKDLEYSSFEELRAVFADFDSRGVGLRVADNLPREALYDRNAIR
jgi:DNA-damage-inducible protein J